MLGELLVRRSSRIRRLPAPMVVTETKKKPRRNLKRKHSPSSPSSIGSSVETRQQTDIIGEEKKVHDEMEKRFCGESEKTSVFSKDVVDHLELPSMTSPTLPSPSIEPAVVVVAKVEPLPVPTTVVDSSSLVAKESLACPPPPPLSPPTTSSEASSVSSSSTLLVEPVSGVVPSVVAVDSAPIVVPVSIPHPLEDLFCPPPPLACAIPESLSSSSSSSSSSILGGDGGAATRSLNPLEKSPTPPLVSVDILSHDSRLEPPPPATFTLQGSSEAKEEVKSSRKENRHSKSREESRGRRRRSRQRSPSRRHQDWYEERDIYGQLVRTRNDVVHYQELAQERLDSIRKLERRLDESKAKEKEWDRRNQNQKGTIKHLERRCSTLENHREEDRNTIAKLTRDLNTSENQLDTLPRIQRELAEAKKIHQDCESMLQTQFEEIQRLRDRCAKLEAHRDEDRVTIANLGSDLDAASRDSFKWRSMVVGKNDERVSYERGRHDGSSSSTNRYDERERNSSKDKRERYDHPRHSSTMADAPHLPPDSYPPAPSHVPTDESYIALPPLPYPL